MLPLESTRNKDLGPSATRSTTLYLNLSTTDRGDLGRVSAALECRMDPQFPEATGTRSTTMSMRRTSPRRCLVMSVSSASSKAIHLA
jgi:hypothetical protein